MAAPRLPFLWPMLFMPTKAPRPQPCAVVRKTRASRQFAASARWNQESRTQRYGTAQEPAPHLRKQESAKGKAAAKAKETVAKAKDTVDKNTPPEPPPEATAAEEQDEPIASPQPDVASPRVAAAAAGAPLDAPPDAPPDPPRAPDAKPLDTVLHMPSPQEEESRKPPHLKTPPYVHHFDTYSLVRQLVKGTFTDAQSVTIMKAVRGILTDNMELAREGLVSKSNVENETYLFKAACSELRTEVGNNRKSEAEKSRSERNQLQHEVDILGQKMGQETSHLKDELKGLFDDRKMAVRQEQRSMESKIQELNYKITVALNSDARSEVEGLRWVLTRRAAITVAISAFMLIVALRYSSHVAHVQQEQKKKDEQNRSPSGDPGNDGSPTAPSPPPPGSLGEQEVVAGELLAANGVSLG